MKTLFKSCFLLAIVFATASCNQDDGLQIQSNSKQFNMDLFIENVNDAMENKAVGYGLVISQNGQAVFMDAQGVRIQGNASGVSDVNQNIHQPMYAASISKNITAVAALKLMAENNIDVDDKVWNYLPAHWNVHSSFKQLSFRNLFQHRSGISSSVGYTYDALRDLAENGVSNDKSYEYANANYSLFRILIPYMIGPIASNSDAWLDDFTASTYRNYIQTNLFDPLEIYDVDTKPVGNNPTLYYNMNDTWGTPGWTIGDRTNISGGGGWYISPFDLAKFYAYVEHSEQVISSQVRTERDLLFLGWDQTSSESVNNDYGVYHAKNGSLQNDPGQGVLNLYKKFNKNGVQIVVMMNSRGGAFDNGTSLNSAFRDAYDNAWE